MSQFLHDHVEVVFLNARIRIDLVKESGVLLHSAEEVENHLDGEHSVEPELLHLVAMAHLLVARVVHQLVVQAAQSFG